ncbi:MAG: TonB-dependent receptor, partial [Hyphomonas sp.]|nr:TonB-dependent receptor [Hyphomonas sp.]
EPTDWARGWVSVEHFEEDDSRLRSGKQICKKDPGFDSFMGLPVSAVDQLATSVGCIDAPLDQSNDRVNSSATLAGGLGIFAGLLNGDVYLDPAISDLRKIESAFDPMYKAEQTLYSWKAEADIGDNLLLTYLGSYSDSSIVSIEDYNKVAPTIEFNATAGPFINAALAPLYPLLFPGGVVTDPELGSSNVFRTFDMSGADSEQTSHELRLQSDYDGRFNFNLGAISVDFESVDAFNPTDGYFVLSNALTALTQINNAAGGALFGGNVPLDSGSTASPGASLFDQTLNGDGGNYFRSLSPYKLESFAVFGEGYYDVTDDLQLTVGLRYTDDQKEQKIVPTALVAPQAPGVDPRESQGLLKADFQEITGRIGFDYTADLDFTDDTLIYGFYSKGYKGGGINPPQPEGASLFPQTFDPEFINSYEIGTKNTFAGGTAQLNLTGFMYDYEGYQITQIINRSSVNINVDAELQGFEMEALWTPADNWLLTANLGLLNAEVADTYGIDVLDRSNGRADLVTLKNSSSYSNCVVSAQGYATVLGAIQGNPALTGATL